MNLEQRIEALVFLGKAMQENDENWSAIILQAKQKNPWFTPENCKSSILAIAENYLDGKMLKHIKSKYPQLDANLEKRVGIIAAGNIPLVGMHDIISCFLSGNVAVIKLSEKDAVLIPHCIDLLTQAFPAASTYFSFVERLDSFNAVIATGSNNTSRYFEQYFSKYPHIIRKNRNGLAVLSGQESDEELLLLGKDIFDYFGLGCRNVSKVFVPKDYPMEQLMQKFEHFKEISYHNKYKNNLDYNGAIYLLNKEAHLISDFLVLRESDSLSSRIACLHYQYYNSLNEVTDFIKSNDEKIQCVVTNMELENIHSFNFGQAQNPAFFDFADGLDTLDFLQSL